MPNIKSINGYGLTATDVELADNSLDGAVLEDGSVGGAKLENRSVTGNKLADGSVDGTKLDVTLTYTVTDGDLTISLT